MIKVSTKTSYGLRLMINLALNFKERPTIIKNVAEKENISPRYLEQIVIPLKNSGLVRSIRGAKGGYVLTKDPSQITLFEVMRVLEGSWAFVECTENPDFCSKRDACPAFVIWDKAYRALNAVFEGFTLKDCVDIARKMGKEKKEEEHMKEKWFRDFYKKDEHL